MGRACESYDYSRSGFLFYYKHLGAGGLGLVFGLGEVLLFLRAQFLRLIFLEHMGVFERGGCSSFDGLD